MEALPPLLPSWFFIYAVALPVAIVWSSIWKGIALWQAGRNNQLAWYIILFIINTLGILEIIYIFAVSRKKAGS